jgi:hypothetical protein
MNRKPLFVIATILALAVILPGAGIAMALGPQPAAETIAYPGRLSDDAGQPVPDGDYDFTFALYDALEGGSLLWSETQSRVAVKGGAFTALLGSANPIPKEVQASGRYWLAVEVRGPGEAAFTALNQRQELSGARTSAAKAGAACPHDHFGETWEGTGAALVLRSDGGGGTTLFVHTSGDHDGVRAYSYGTTPSTAALVGFNQSTGAGVYGSSANGSGVVANSSATGTALNILQGAIKVTGAGVDTDTTVFIHQAHTGAGGNICPGLINTTVIDHPLTNDDPNAILIITVNGGTMGGLVTPNDPMMAVSYDTNNICGFGQRWLIANLSYNAIPDGAKFNVMVVKP